MDAEVRRGTASAPVRVRSNDTRRVRVGRVRRANEGIEPRARRVNARDARATDHLGSNYARMSNSHCWVRRRDGWIIGRHTKRLVQGPRFHRFGRARGHTWRERQAARAENGPVRVGCSPRGRNRGAERRFKGFESGTRTSGGAPGAVRIISRGAAKRREAKRRASVLRFLQRTGQKGTQTRPNIFGKTGRSGHIRSRCSRRMAGNVGNNNTIPLIDQGGPRRKTP